MPRRIIPVLCALVVALVPATALAQPAQDPSPAAPRGGVVYGDTKYDLQNQAGPGLARRRHGVRAGDLGRHEGRPAPRDRASRHARRRRPPSRRRPSRRRPRPTATRPTAGRSPPWVRRPSSRPSRSARSRWWRAASIALPTWGSRGARRSGRGRTRPRPLGHSRRPPGAHRSRYQRNSRHAHPPHRGQRLRAVPRRPRRRDRQGRALRRPRSPHRALVAVGDTKDDLPGAVPAVPAGDTKGDLTGAVAAIPAGDTKADLPARRRARVRTTPPWRRSATSQRPASTDDGTSGWRLAAVIEAGCPRRPRARRRPVR